MQSKPLKVFEDVNWDFNKEGFEEKVKILINYLSWLWMIAKKTSDLRKSNKIYRGINYKAHREYEK